VNIYKKSGEHITGFRYTLKKNEAFTWVDMQPKIMPGKYFFTLQMLTEESKLFADEVVASEFTITSEYVETIEEWSGLVSVDHTWNNS
jgi:hypothetical protein